MSNVPTLEEWVEQNGAILLRRNIQSAVEAMLPELAVEDRQSAVRIFMIFIRDWAQDQKL